MIFCNKNEHSVINDLTKNKYLGHVFNRLKTNLKFIIQNL